MRLYISGPMRGIPCYNFPEFDSLADYLTDRGYQYINPADHDRVVEPDLEVTKHYLAGDPSLNDRDNFHQLLGWDLAQIASPECDGVVMLPGWENSTGAQHERYVAEACGKAVWLAKRTRMLGLWTLESCSNRSLSAKKEWVVSDGIHRNSLQPTPTPVMPEGFSRAADGWTTRTQDIRAAGSIDYTSITGQGHAFTTKDSGVRKAFDSGMVRDTDEGKPRYDLIPLLPLRRLAELYARGAVKYGPSNWQKANSDEELKRFKASAFRHLVQALDGDRDEDHWSGVVFNVFAAEWLEEKLGQPVPLHEYARDTYKDSRTVPPKPWSGELDRNLEHD